VTEEDGGQWPEDVAAAIRTTSGAHFYRCALQVNPFAYVKRGGAAPEFVDESAYNAAIVKACLETRTDVVGLGDHHTVRGSEQLRAELTQAGVSVFPGFEAKGTDGVHVQVLFDPSTEVDKLLERLGAIGASPDDPYALAKRVDFRHLLELVDEWGAIAIAGQVTRASGLLDKLSGQSRLAAWTDPRLLAAAVPQQTQQITDEGSRQILDNVDSQYRREFPVALLYANDVCGPRDLQRDNTWTWIKMVEPSIEGLRSAFRDPESRVRLPPDSPPVEHPRIIALGWQGASAHLGGSRLHLNPDLNVLVGGRGSGKSTIVESIRFALGQQPTGPESQRTHQDIVRDVLRPHTRVWMLVRSTGVSSRDYLIERTVSGTTSVTDSSGREVGLDPGEIFPQAEIWGQREIAELAGGGTARNRLLQRFVTDNEGAQARKRELRKGLEENRLRMRQLRAESRDVAEEVAGLPALEEQISRYADAGVEERMHEQAAFVRERGLLDTAAARLGPVDDARASLNGLLPIDTAFLEAAVADELPDADLLSQARDVLDQLTRGGHEVLETLTGLVERAHVGLSDIQSMWEQRSSAAASAYAERLRGVERSDTEGEDYLGLLRRLERLVPLRERRRRLDSELAILAAERQELLGEWHEARTAEVQGLRGAADYVNGRLGNATAGKDGQVKVAVTADGDRAKLNDLVQAHVGGRHKKTLEQAELKGVAPGQLAALCRQGADVLRSRLETTQHEAENFYSAGPDFFEQLEELDLSPTTEVSLRVGKEWRPHDRLSKGQQATAFLLLLLVGADGSGPLVVDQPEEDLDNRFITDAIVPTMRAEKQRRQFLFTSHNPNIPVLGDAELIAEVRVDLVGDVVKGRVGPPAVAGSIDTSEVRNLVEETLEGGRAAFARRRRKYGF